jgi:hypothetical protein
VSAQAEQRRHGEAACAVWRDGPSWDGTATAVIGRFGCGSAEAGARLLAETLEALKAEGCAAVLGPMEGDTWHSYRLVTEPGGRAPFLMEPRNGPEAVAAFRAAGFAPVAEYASALCDAAERRVGLKGSAAVRLRPFDAADAGRELERLYRISLEAFRSNAFYTPIDEGSFRALYEPLLPRLVPDLLLIAEDEARAPVGFVFGLPDWAEGPAPRTAILKTYAALRPGVGTMLSDAFHRNALRLGYRHVIHALMHADNVSLRYSRLIGGVVFRRYALFGRRLQA